MEGKLEHMDHNLNILVYICYIVIFDIGRMSHVMCHMSQYIYIYIYFFGGACRWRVCYQRGLPRLFSYCFLFFS